MEPIAIVSVQPDTLTIDEHGMHKIVSLDHTTVVPCNEPAVKALQRLPVEEEPLTENGIGRQNTQIEPTEYTVDHSTHTKDQKLTFATECYCTSIHQSMILRNLRSTGCNTSWIITKRGKYTAIDNKGTDITAKSHQFASLLIQIRFEAHTFCDLLLMFSNCNFKLASLRMKLTLIHFKVAANR